MFQNLRGIYTLFFALLIGGVSSAQKYIIASDINDLVDGDKVIIANTNNAKVMGGKRDNKNNRSAIDCTINANGTINFVEGFSVFTISKSSSYYYFYDSENNGYLAATSNTNNELVTISSKTNASKATITIADNIANITFNSGSKTQLQYYKNNNLFSCYSPGSPNVQIYKDFGAFSLSLKSVTIKEHDTFDISSYIIKNDDYTGILKYSVTEGGEYISVSDNGEVTGNAEGKGVVKITAPETEGFSESSCLLNVEVVTNKSETSTSFDKDQLTIIWGEEDTYEKPTLTKSHEYDVTYSSDNTDVADIDSETGELNLHKFGTANITAKFEGNDNYLPSNATYTLNYQAYHTEEFDFSKPQNYGYNDNSTFEDGDKIVSGIVTLTNVKNASTGTKTRFFNSTNYPVDLRAYRDAVLSVGVPEGYMIKYIYIKNDNDVEYQLGGKSNSKTNKEATWDGYSNLVYIDNLTDGVYFQSMTVQYIKTDALDEMSMNTIEEKNTNAMLTRTLSKDYWNTFCIPFSMSAEQIAERFGDVTIAEFTSVENETTMVFSILEENRIDAGTPCLIKPSNDITNPVIEGITYSVTNPKAVSFTNSKGESYSFTGTFSPTELEYDGTDLFINNKGEVLKPTATGNRIYGMRAYLTIPISIVDGKITLNVDDSNGITTVKAEDNNHDDHIYNLNGQCVGSTSKGIYIKKGKKYIVK
ncbi:MAG: hypothetical protein ACI4A7_07585 [Prevotella sp.]